MNESLFCAREKFDDSILVSYADIVFEQQIIEQILKFRQDIGVAINLDWKKNYENRTMHPLSEAENVLIENYKCCADLERILLNAYQIKRLGSF